jgi:hypothetical protein
VAVLAIPKGFKTALLQCNGQLRRGRVTGGIHGAEGKMHEKLSLMSVANSESLYPEM